MSYNTSTGVSQAANELFGSLKHRAKLAQFYFTDIERAVVKATSPETVVPKAKHVQNMISATYENRQYVTDIIGLIDKRLHSEKSWIIAFKSLIVIHQLLREGSNEMVVGYMSQHPNVLTMTSFRDTTSGSQGLEQAANIKSYAAYLEERVLTANQLRHDYTRSDGPDADRMSALTWKNGLVDVIQTLQRQIRSLLECRYYLDSINNDVTTESLRLLVKDLLRLFQVLNEGVIKILKEFFNLSQQEASKALEIYRNFVRQTEQVTEYLEMARKIQYGLGMTVPEIKHAPLSLVDTLQDYVNSKDFEDARSRNQQSTKSGKQMVDIFAPSALPPQQPPRQQVAIAPNAPVKQQQQQQPDIFDSLASNSLFTNNQQQPRSNQMQQPQQPQRANMLQKQQSSSNFDDLLGINIQVTQPQQQQQPPASFMQQPQPFFNQQQQQFNAQSSMVSIGLGTPQQPPRANSVQSPQFQMGNNSGFMSPQQQQMQQQQRLAPPAAQLQQMSSQSSFQSVNSGQMRNYSVVPQQSAPMQSMPSMPPMQAGSSSQFPFQQQPLFSAPIPQPAAGPFPSNNNNMMIPQQQQQLQQRPLAPGNSNQPFQQQQSQQQPSMWL